MPPSAEARGRIPRPAGDLLPATKAVQEHDAGHPPGAVPAVREVLPRGGLRVRVPQGEPVPVQPSSRRRRLRELLNYLDIRQMFCAGRKKHGLLSCLYV